MSLFLLTYALSLPPRPVSHKVPPKIAHFDFGDHAINFEESVSVNCLIYLGDLPMDITWLFNGAHINAYTGVSIVKGGKKASILTIDSVHAGHAGNYTCKARNDADSAEYTAELIVNGIGRGNFRSDRATFY